MKEAGAKAIAMEVSSHALDQYRVDGSQFDAVLWTNFSQDHLDYHSSMNSYFQAKERLFRDLLWMSLKQPRVAVVGLANSFLRQVRVAGPAQLLTFSAQSDADFTWGIEELSFSGTRFRLNTPLRSLSAWIPLCGEHNVANVVGTLASLWGLGVSPEVALKALENFSGIPGRLQRVADSDRAVFVDYAHTPDALENVLRTLSLVRQASRKTNSKIHVIFGCGGDRDVSKRALMAKVAEQGADHVMVTSDNPRTEDPQKICDDIRRGFAKPEKVIFEIDREKAIERTLQSVSGDDVVLIAGKGHETYQIVGTEKKLFLMWRQL